MQFLFSLYFFALICLATGSPVQPQGRPLGRVRRVRKQFDESIELHYDPNADYGHTIVWEQETTNPDFIPVTEEDLENIVAEILMTASELGFGRQSQTGLERVTIFPELIQELDTSGALTGLSDFSKRHILSLEIADFDFGTPYQRLFGEVLALGLNTTLLYEDLGATLEMEFLLFLESGSIEFHQQTYNVRAGDLAIAMNVKNWPFCDQTTAETSLANCGTDNDGEVLRLSFFVDGKYGEVDEATNGEFVLGNLATLKTTTKFTLDGVVTDVVTGTPVMETRDRLYVKLPKFEGTASFVMVASLGQGTASPTASISPSASASPSASPSATPSTSTSASSSVSASSSTSSTVSPSATASVSASASMTVTPSSSLTPTSSLSLGVSPSTSATVSATNSVSMTASSSVSSTASSTVSASVTPSSSLSPTTSMSATASKSPTASKSNSKSPSTSKTCSPTVSLSSSASTSSSVSASSSVSVSPSSTRSISVSTSLTASISTTPSSSPTISKQSTTPSTSPSSSVPSGKYVTAEGTFDGLTGDTFDDSAKQALECGIATTVDVTCNAVTVTEFSDASTKLGRLFVKFRVQVPASGSAASVANKLQSNSTALVQNINTQFQASAVPLSVSAASVQQVQVTDPTVVDDQSSGGGGGSSVGIAAGAAVGGAVVVGIAALWIFKKRKGGAANVHKHPAAPAVQIHPKQQPTIAPQLISTATVMDNNGNDNDDIIKTSAGFLATLQEDDPVPHNLGLVPEDDLPVGTTLSATVVPKDPTNAGADKIGHTFLKSTSRTNMTRNSKVTKGRDSQSSAQDGDGFGDGDGELFKDVLGKSPNDDVDDSFL